MRICETLATQASPTLGINKDDCWAWNNMQYVQWCVSELQGEVKVTVQLSAVGFGLECVSKSVYSTPGWLYRDWRCWDFVSAVMQASTAFCMWDLSTVSTVQPLCWSAAQWYWLPLYKITGYSNVLVLLRKVTWNSSMMWEGGELRHTQMVYGVRHLV